MKLSRTVWHHLLLTIALWSATSTGSAAEKEAKTFNVIRLVMQASSDKGVVRCGLFKHKGWLETPLQTATAKPKLVQRDGRSYFYATCTFPGVGKGVYAASAIHDADNNGKLNTNLFGMPTEDYCATNNARGTLGPPSFADAKFQFKGGSLELQARLR